VSKRGVNPSFFSSPSPFKERGIKGVRLINNLISVWHRRSIGIKEGKVED